MFRSLAIVSALGIGVVIGTMDLASAATYCAKYVGGTERVTSGARSQCNFSTLKACRASLRARGGGSCYKRASMR
jgi:hypothetical protein